MKRTTFSEQEWEIMSVLWKMKQATVKDVWQALYPNAEKAYTTVQTVMERLVKKRALEKEKIGLVNFYRPAISRQAAAEQVTKSLAKRLFGGSFGNLAAFLIQNENLTAEELELIREMLRKKEKELKK